MIYYLRGTIRLHVSIVVQCSKLAKDMRICYCVWMRLVCLCGTIHSNMSRFGFGMPYGLVVVGDLVSWETVGGLSILVEMEYWWE